MGESWVKYDHYSTKIKTACFEIDCDHVQTTWNQHCTCQIAPAPPRKKAKTCSPTTFRCFCCCCSSHSSTFQSKMTRLLVQETYSSWLIKPPRCPLLLINIGGIKGKVVSQAIPQILIPSPSTFANPKGKAFSTSLIEFYGSTMQAQITDITYWKARVR